METITAITGPMRSGTSFITGFLEQCGMDLGTGVRVLRRQTEHNPCGHFEPDLLAVINSRLLEETPGRLWGHFDVPDHESLANLAMARERYFKLFIRKFDGEICKDPLFCLTLPFWEENWPQLKRNIFCLRHPLASARSMQRRYGETYGLTLEKALAVWFTYVDRFVRIEKRSDVYVFNFDAFVESPHETIESLLQWLDISLSMEIVEKRLAEFYKPHSVHWGNNNTSGDFQIPIHILELYENIKADDGMGTLQPGKVSGW